MRRHFWLVTLQAVLCFAVMRPAIGAENLPKGPIQWSQPVNQAQIDYAVQLDQLLDRHDYRALGEKVLKPTDPSMILPILDWAKARTYAGGSVIIALLDAHLLWAIGSSNPSARSLLETSAMFALYAFLVENADGVKCEDQTALAHHSENLFIKYVGQFKLIAAMPEDRKALLIRTALAMEAKTHPLRGNDNYLCRFGLKEMQANLEKHSPERELPNTKEGYHGKVIEVESDLNYEPRYLPPEQWEKKQADIRAQLPIMVTALIERYSKAQPKTP